MDVGHVQKGTQQRDPWDAGDPWGVAAVGKGKPANGGKCFACGGNHFAANCPNKKGKVGKGKGKGKDGKGKGKNPTGREGWGICRSWLRTGTCPRGDNCPWAHAKVPRNLQGINDLVLEDLGAVTFKDGQYVMDDEAAVDPAKLIAEINAEIAGIEKELAEGWKKVGDGEGSGFTGPPQV